MNFEKQHEYDPYELLLMDNCDNESAISIRQYNKNQITYTLQQDIQLKRITYICFDKQFSGCTIK